MSIRISDLASLTDPASGDMIPIVDYSANTTKKVLLSTLSVGLIEALAQEHPGVRRNIFLGRNLGNSVTSAQISSIRSGKFDGMFVGDYWLINGNQWRIADMDYWYRSGTGNNFQTHHVVIFPDTAIGDGVMNDTATTEGGYINSKMRTEILPSFKNVCEAAFPSLILTHKEYLTSAAVDGTPSGAGWYDSDIEIPNQISVLGSQVMMPKYNGNFAAATNTIDNMQMALFRIAPPHAWFPETKEFWLRDIVSGTQFTCLNGGRNADTGGATTKRWIRPVFAIG